MRRFKNFIKGVMVILVVFALLYCLKWTFFNIIKKDQTINGMKELSKVVLEDMRSGKERDYIVVKDVSDSQLAAINQVVDSAYGHVDTYRVLVSFADTDFVELRYTRSDNYYVLMKYLYDQDIPAEQMRARAIYNEIIDLLEQVDDNLSDYSKELLAHDYVVNRCQYGYGDDENDAYTTYGALVDGFAVCDGYSQSFALLLDCMGVKNELVVGYGLKELHAWNQVCIEGQWYNVDCTWDDSDVEQSLDPVHTYFNVDDINMAYEHSWDRELYNECAGEEYNYYRVNNTVYNDLSELESDFGRVYDSTDTNVFEMAVRDEMAYDISLDFLTEYIKRHKVQYSVTRLKDYYVVIVYR